MSAGHAQACTDETSYHCKEYIMKPTHFRKGKTIYPLFPETHRVKVMVKKTKEDGTVEHVPVDQMRAHPHAGKPDMKNGQGFSSVNAAKRHSRTVIGLGRVITSI